MIEEFKWLLQTHIVCPFCGKQAPKEHAIEGLNCRICEPCGENIEHLTPYHADIYGGNKPIGIWEFDSPCREWQRGNTPNPILVDLNGDIEDLSPAEQASIVAFSPLTPSVVSFTHSSIEGSFTPVPKENVHSEYLKIISASTGNKSNHLASVKAKIPTPTITTGHHVYTTDEDELLTEPENTSSESSQVKLGDLWSST